MPFTVRWSKVTLGREMLHIARDGRGSARHGPDGDCSCGRCRDLLLDVDALTVPDSSTTPVDGVCGGGGAVAQAAVDVTSCAAEERLPAASYATTANVYDVPHASPELSEDGVVADATFVPLLSTS